MDADLKRLADAAESLEAQARELRAEIERLSDAQRERARAEQDRATAERERAAAERERASEADGASAGVAQPTPAAAATPPADDSEARLVAYSMVLDGNSREDVAKHLEDELGLSDSDALLDDVFERASV